ncbi:serine/threonine-protein kinase Nek2-like [Neocloeon triangulifer]|uniref:serine/threonine-protein kinase Nek2-like n=1 Tax=Neocloeon triangulifer TaxID=2078957 RepID=UPI00286EC41F|nr:serine/threonine-protein kinase Nek2-like [Neocloeon triangulifer]
MDVSDFIIGPLLGEGTFGRSYKVRRKTDKKKLVMRRIETSCPSNKKVVSQEIAIQGLLGDSSHLVKLFGHFVDKTGVVCLLVEYCKERDLQHLVTKTNACKDVIQDEFIYKVIKGLSEALLYLEEREILHRNVKPSSVFLTSEFTPKLGGFRHAHYLLTPPVSNGEITAFSPPEIVLCQPVTFKTDVWSVGCIAYYLHQLNPPFTGANEELRKNICGRSIRVASTREHCKKMFDFIGPMMASNCFYRPTYKEILHHPLMQIVKEKARPFKHNEELTNKLSKINIQSSGTDSSESLQTTTAKLNPYFVSRPGNFPLPPRKVRFLNDGSKEVSYKWYEIDPKPNVDTAMVNLSTNCLKPEQLPFLSEIHNFKFGESNTAKKTEKPGEKAKGNYTKEDLEKAVAEKLAMRKFTMKYLRKTGKENYVVKHTKL